MAGQLSNRVAFLGGQLVGQWSGGVSSAPTSAALTHWLYRSQPEVRSQTHVGMYMYMYISDLISSCSRVNCELTGAIKNNFTDQES